MDTWSLPGFTELNALGEGGFGRVVLARHDASNSVVAIKYLFRRHLTDPARVAAFRREAAMLSRIHSPHVTRLYEFVETPQGAAIVMEAVRGISLRELLAVDGRLEPEAALAVLKGSLLGLADAHRVDIVHRDYKPDNVLVGPGRESKLVDFGIAVLAGEAGVPVGTPAYMAPEQWAGLPASPATDVYAATCVFFHGITGRRPFEAEQVETLRELHQHAPVPAGLAPEPVRGLIACGMAKTPAERPFGAAEFVAELEAAAVAGYGEDWEERGLGRLARRAGVLLALSPLALLGAGTAAAPGIAGGITAGTAGTAAGTAGAAAGTVGATAAGAAVKVIGIVGAVLVAVAAAVAAIVVATPSGSNQNPPPLATGTASATPVALAVDLPTRTENDGSFDVSAQYARVSGISDPAVQQRVNAALTAPLDQWIDYVRRGVTGPEEDGDIPHVHNEVKIGRQDRKVLSVRYTLTVDSAQFGNHGAASIQTINLDLATGQEVTAQDVFRDIAKSAQGMSMLSQRILAQSPGGFCGDTSPVDNTRGLEPRDLEPYSAGGEEALQVGFTTDGVNFLVKASALGYPMVCDPTEIIVPYRNLSDLMTSEARALLL